MIVFMVCRFSFLSRFLGIRRIAYEFYCRDNGRLLTDRRCILLLFQISALFKGTRIVEDDATRSGGPLLGFTGKKQPRYRRYSWSKDRAPICKHVEHILSKLNVENRTAAAVIALETYRSATTAADSKSGAAWAAISGFITSQLCVLCSDSSRTLRRNRASLRLSSTVWRQLPIRGDVEKFLSFSSPLERTEQKTLSAANAPPERTIARKRAARTRPQSRRVNQRYLTNPAPSKQSPELSGPRRKFSKKQFVQSRRRHQHRESDRGERRLPPGLAHGCDPTARRSYAAPCRADNADTISNSQLRAVSSPEFSARQSNVALYFHPN